MDKPLNTYTPELDQWIRNGVKHALIDVDNTLVKANIAELYLRMRKNSFKRSWAWRLWLAGFAAFWAPIYLLLDAMNREWFQRAFYRRFRAFSPEQIDQASEELVQEKCRTRLISYTHQLIPYLQKNNINVILLSTNIEPVVKRMAQRYGVDYLCLPVLQNGTAAQVGLDQLRDFKKNHATRYPSESLLAVADSKHDLPVLQHAAYSIVIEDRPLSWMKKIGGTYIRVPGALFQHGHDYTENRTHTENIPSS
ncbi:HAD family phosphatase [Paenibacillus sp. 1011MAR3C5]|uniref:HAD family hydrolase n=1 Tax=Paenibacillus sp. 1011MAR3C5 TaxID=1675787 RepID=UPI0016018C5F|nr:HAD family hydrolase [Paenibacillus sp. 1011MAR3C5]